MMKHKQYSQRGAVSIFVVVFCALFVTIITVSFVSLMIRGQQQATNADLSNSAYDAALAGVEDAKRVLLKYRQCLQNSTAHSDCATVISLFANPRCNMVRYALTGFNDEDETIVKANSGADTTSQDLDQAYTCVQIDYTSEEKVLDVPDGSSALVPLDANGAPFDRVNISWFKRDSASSIALSLPGLPPSGPNLPTKTQWNSAGAGFTRPPILRTQLIQHGSSFSSADFDADDAAGNANAKTVFLYPSQAGAGTVLLDDRPAANPTVKSPQQASCSATNYNNAEYACSIDIALPEPKNPASRSAYLNLGALYNSTRVRIMLKNGSDPVSIIAPTIDATGRANDLFRRVKVGVSFTGEYPKAGFDIGGNLCKDFGVTNDSYIDGGCNPNSPNG